MTRRVPDLSEALVRKHLQEVLDTCRETNTRPSVLMLARRLDLTNTTFRRRYPRSRERSPGTEPPPPPCAAVPLSTTGSSPATRSSAGGSRADRPACPRRRPGSTPRPTPPAASGSTGVGVERHEHQQQAAASMNQARRRTPTSPPFSSATAAPCSYSALHATWP